MFFLEFIWGWFRVYLRVSLGMVANLFRVYLGLVWLV